MPNALLSLPPLYTVVGLYRLTSDSKIRGPVWDKCRNGTRRGAIVAAVYGVVVYSPLRWFVGFFLSKSPRLESLLYVPYITPHFSVQTWATVLFLTSQMSGIIRFFLSKNLRIAKDRAWELTVSSRGKGPDFWGPYIEEWQVPPKMPKDAEVGWLEGFLGKWWARMIVNRFVLFPMQLYPFVGLAVSAWMRAYGTSRYLHSKYFKSKNMTSAQISVYMEERKWDYRLFGFTSAILESIPIIGIVFSVSNQIGAAMWAHDLEKRQTLFRNGTLKPLPPHIVKLEDGTTLTLRPAGTGLFSAIKGKSIQSGMTDNEDEAFSATKEQQIPGGLDGTVTAGVVGHEMRKLKEQ